MTNLPGKGQFPMRYTAGIVFLMFASGVLLAGCGGSKVVTGTTTAAAPSKEIELLRYLSRTARALKPYRAGLRLDDAAEKLVVGRTSTLAERRRASQLLVEAAERLELSSVKQLQAQPPPALRASNRSFALLSTRLGSYDRRRAVTILDKDWPASWNAMVNEAISGTDARSEWRDQVTAYASQIGVRLPAWVKIIGTPFGPKA